jgi:hypothetical protein
MIRALPAAVVLSLLVLSGLVHGLWTGRWQGVQGLDCAGVRLDQVPTTLGGWQSEPLPLDPKHIAQAGLSGCWMRRYVRGLDGPAVTVLLMCGRSGPVSIHTPDICYGGAGYDMVGQPVRITAATAPQVEFWTARFRKEGAVVPSYLRIFWAWSADGTWQAPDRPRLTFASFPVLYKLYVLRELDRPEEPLEDDPCLRFLRDALPEVGPALFNGAPSHG